MKEKTTPLLIGLLVIAAFAIGVLWQRISSLEKKEKIEQGETPTLAPKHALDSENLKLYAQELELDEEVFNQCLDSGKYQERVNQDINLAESLKIRGTPGFLINGRFLGGAFPFESFKEIIDKEIAGQGSENVKDYSEDLQQAAQQDSFDPKVRRIEILEDDPFLGSVDALVTLVEFSDFECPFCARAYPTVKQILEEYEGKVRFVYKQLPLVSIHQYAQKAAEASLCAKEQGKFFEYHDKLFESQKI